MAFYECTILARQELSSAQVTALTDDVTTLAKDNGGRVAKTEYWGLRTLAYRMNKAKKAHYSYLELDIPAAGMQEICRLLGLNDNVMRSLVVKIDALQDGPSPMLVAKQREENRMEGDFTDGFDGQEKSRGGDEGYRRAPRSNPSADSD